MENNKYDLQNLFANSSWLENYECRRMNLIDQTMKAIGIVRGNIENGNFLNSTFEESKFFDTKFSGCDFRFISFNSCHFQNIKFDSCEMRKVIFDNCTFINCSFDIQNNISSMDTLLINNSILNKVDMSDTVFEDNCPNIIVKSVYNETIISSKVFVKKDNMLIEDSKKASTPTKKEPRKSIPKNIKKEDKPVPEKSIEEDSDNNPKPSGGDGRFGGLEF